MKLAWEVTDEENGSTVVFASTEYEAANIGASELLSDTESVIAERSPDYDQYAEQGYVPIKVLYDNYWWFGCWQCDRKVSVSDEDEDDESNPLDPVFEERRLFCCGKCQERYYQEMKQRECDRAAAKEYLLQKLPGIEIGSVWGGSPGYPVSVEFKFPGGKHTVQWSNNEKGIFLVTKVDLEAWDKYQSTILAGAR
jgi:hypothetical protein